MAYIFANRDKDKIALGTIYLSLQTQDGSFPNPANPYTPDAYVRIVRFGTFKIGADDGSDVIFRPNSIEIDICPEDNKLTTYADLFYKLTQYKTTALFFCRDKNGNDVFYFKGAVHDEPKGNPDTRIVSITIVDDLRVLRDVNLTAVGNNNPLSLTGKQPVMDVVKAIVSYQNSVLTEVLTNCPVMIESDYTYGGVKLIGTLDGAYDIANDTHTPDAGCKISVDCDNFFNTNYAELHAELLSTLKYTLLSFGCVGFFMPDKTFIMASRWYNNDPDSIVTINIRDVNSISEGSDLPIRRMESYVHTGYAAPNAWKLHVATDPLYNSQDTESYLNFFTGGTYQVSPPLSFDGLLYIYVPNANGWATGYKGITSDRAWIGGDSEHAARPNWQCVHDQNWKVINKTRLKVELEIAGLDFSPLNFYKLSHYTSVIFRITMMELDYVKQTTKMTLLEC